MTLNCFTGEGHSGSFSTKAVICPPRSMEGPQKIQSIQLACMTNIRMVGFLPAIAFFPPYFRSYYVEISIDKGGHVPNAGSVPIILCIII